MKKIIIILSSIIVIIFIILMIFLFNTNSKDKDIKDVKKNKLMKKSLRKKIMSSVNYLIIRKRILKDIKLIKLIILIFI